MANDEFVLIKIAEETYAIDILDINEINRCNEVKLTKLLNAPKHIEGIINLRGEVVPIVNMRVVMKLKKLKKIINSRRGRIVIVKKNEIEIGLLVDLVKGVFYFDKEKFKIPSEKLREKNEYIKGVIARDEELIFWMDINKI